MGANASRTAMTPDPVNKRLLEVDPRSPTEGIMRTPIVVAATPVHPAAPVETVETPETVYSFDPRSPAEKFERSLVVKKPLPVQEPSSPVEEEVEPLTPEKKIVLEKVAKILIAQENTPEPGRKMLLFTETGCATPPTTPMKSKTRKALTPLASRSPNVNFEGLSLETKFPTARKNLRQVAYQNQAKKKGVNQENNAPKALRL